MSSLRSYESVWEDIDDEDDLAFQAADIVYEMPGYCDQRYLRSLPYDEYLQSNHWQTTRKRALLRAGNQCQLCESSKQLNVHHLSYGRRGREKEVDIIVLCWRCHGWVHADPDREIVLRWLDLPRARFIAKNDEAVRSWADFYRAADEAEKQRETEAYRRAATQGPTP